MRIHCHRGFTLIEMLCVVTLLALLASIGLPNFGDLIERNRIQSLRNQLEAQLKHARASAVLHNRSVEICGSSDGRTCDDAWQSGWLIHRPDSTLINSQYTLSAGERMDWSGAAQRIIVLGNGTLLKGNGRFYFCRHDDTVALQLVISRQGRIRSVDGLERSQNAGIRCN